MVSPSSRWSAISIICLASRVTPYILMFSSSLTKVSCTDDIYVRWLCYFRWSPESYSPVLFSWQWRLPLLVLLFPIIYISCSWIRVESCRCFGLLEGFRAFRLPFPSCFSFRFGWCMRWTLPIWTGEARTLWDILECAREVGVADCWIRKPSILCWSWQTAPEFCPA